EVVGIPRSNEVGHEATPRGDDDTRSSHRHGRAGLGAVPDQYHGGDLSKLCDPTGPANIPDNTSRLRAPLLWVAGTADRSQTGPDYAFSRAPANPQNRYIAVDSDHLGTP